MIIKLVKIKFWSITMKQDVSNSCINIYCGDRKTAINVEIKNARMEVILH